jgi:hypothetical protein
MVNYTRLEKSDDGQDGHTQNTGLGLAGASNGDGAGGSRRSGNNAGDGANRGVGGEEGGAGATSGERRLYSGGGGSNGDLVGHRGFGSRDDDLRDSDLGGDGLGGAAVGNGDTVRDAGLSDNSGDVDGGVRDRGDGGSASDSEVVGDGVDAGDDGRVLRDVRSAEALEERNSLGNNVIGLTVGVQAGEGLLDELLVGAEAGGVGVVLAGLNEVEPRVQALGDNLGARELLILIILRNLFIRGLGGLLFIILRSLVIRGLGGFLLIFLGSLRGGRGSGGRSVDGAGDGLGDRADSGGERDGLSDDNGGVLILLAAAGLLRAAVSDGLNLSGEDGGGAVIGGGHDSGLRSRGGGGSGRDGGADGSLRGGSGGLGGRSLRSWSSLGDGGGFRSRGGLRGGSSLRNGSLRSRSGGRGAGLGGGLRGRSGLDRSLRGGGGGVGLRSSSSRGRRRNLMGRRRRRGVVDGRRGRSVVVAVEVDLGDLDLALLLLLATVREDDLDILGTTALSVLDLVATASAVVGLLAGRATGHAVVELETSVKLDIDVELLDGEPVYARLRAAAERRGGLKVLATLSDNLLETTIVFAGPALKVEAVVEVEFAGEEVEPVKATLELIIALVVTVARASEFVGVVPLVAEAVLAVAESSRSRADAGGQGQDGNEVLHFESV